MRHSFFIVLKRLFRQTGRRQSGLRTRPPLRLCMFSRENVL
jgi:hypothetical protein